MPKSHVLVVAVDGLRASSLGAYGNTSYSTAALDQFAAESLLLDACFAPSSDVEAIYGSLWHARHPLRRPAPGAESPSLAHLFADQGYRTTLVTDDDALVDISRDADFEQLIQVPPSMTGVFAAAGDSIFLARGSSDNQPHFVWLHARGMYGPWQAPLALQQSLLDEGDPPPIESAEPPDLIITEGDEPDTAFRYGCAYAAQVMVLDDCWNGLMATVDEASRKDDWLIALLGVRGFPLGEHRRIGGIERRLYVEQLHVPWLVRFPDGRGRLSRRSQLTSHLDLLPTLAEWLEKERATPLAAPRSLLPAPCSDGLSVLPLIDALNPPWRDTLLSATHGTRALRTPSWTLRQNGIAELFVRPDDRWEANEVAARCPDVATMLARAAADMGAQIQQGRPITH
jgi:arylsulfatase A-like enzyme